MSCASSLIALGVGYLVYVYASKEKEGLKLLGQVIGVTIMVGTIVSALVQASTNGGGCPLVGKSDKAPMCAFSAKMEHMEHAQEQ